MALKSGGTHYGGGEITNIGVDLGPKNLLWETD